MGCCLSEVDLSRGQVDRRDSPEFHLVARAAGIVAGPEDGADMAIAHGVASLHDHGRFAHREQALLHGDIGKLSHQYRQHPARLTPSPI